MGAAFIAAALSSTAPAAAAQSDNLPGQVSTESGDELNEAAFAHYQAGRDLEAGALFARAIPALERQYGADSPEAMNARGNLALTMSLGGRLADANPIMKQVLAYMERRFGGQSEEVARWTNNIAVNSWLLGRYAEAETLFLRSLEVREKVYGREHRSTLMVLPSLANVYLEQGRYEEAEALYRRAAEDNVRLLGRDDPQTASAVINLAGFYRLRGRYAEAEPLARQAMADHERVLGAEHPNVLTTLNNFADLLRRKGDLAEAEPLFLRLVDARQRVSGIDHPNTQNARVGLAGIYYRQGRMNEAEDLASRAYEGLLRTLGPVNMDTLNAAELLARIRLALPPRAPLALAPARTLFEDARARRAGNATDRHAQAQSSREIGAPTDRLTFLADAAWVSRQQDPVRLREEAFQALQAAIAGKASQSIVRMAVRRYADEAGAGLGALVQERERLDAEWAANMTSLAGTFSGRGEGAERARAAFTARRSAIESRIDAIDQRLRSDFPDYFALIRPEALALAEAQRLLTGEEALMIVLPTQFGTHVVAVTRDRVEWARSDWNAQQVDAAVQRLRWDLGAQVSASQEQLVKWQAEDAANARAGFDRAVAYALHQELIAPVAAMLAGKRRLYVAAGGVLASLPFSVLVTQPPQGSDDDPEALRGTRWLADSHALVHIPSIQSLAALRGPRPQRPGDKGAFIGVGDPLLAGSAVQRGLSRGGVKAPGAVEVFDTSRARGGAVLADVEVLRKLARLSGTAQELESLRQAFDAPASAVLVAENATESAVRSSDLSRARVLAFATHGLTAGEMSDVAEPGLVLTPPARATEADDGYLAASEVSALRLNSDWVILSACNTATGDGSEGLSGLARAFFYAGARSLLASHWPVSDEVAPKLTVRTVELQRGGMSRAEAFQQAAREVRMDSSHDAEESWAHPYYWAPFVLIGDGG